jgi:Transposase IS66 family
MQQRIISDIETCNQSEIYRLVFCYRDVREQAGTWPAALDRQRQNAIYAREGIDLDRSTLGDWVGRMAALLDPLVQAIGRHVCASSVLHADDTTVEVLAPGLGRTRIGRLWAAVRDERTFGGAAAPAAFYRYSPIGGPNMHRPLLGSCRGFLHADGYAGFNSLFAEDAYAIRPARRGSYSLPRPLQARRSRASSCSISRSSFSEERPKRARRSTASCAFRCSICSVLE